MMAAASGPWAKVWRQVGAVADPQPAFEDLAARHAEPQRHYHNLRHISECLEEFDSIRQFAREPLAVELAIWFHDSVYDPHSGDNEEQSAALAVKYIGEAGGPSALCDAVAALILATKTHESGAHPDAPLLVDVDLAILGQPEARFLEYENQIRLEYAWVPAPLFAEKRTEILRRFLDRSRIYSSTPMFTRYERRARANLELSLERLRSRPDGTPHPIP